MSDKDVSPAALNALMISAAVAAGCSREQAYDVARRAGPDRFNLDLTTLDLRDYSGQTFREWLLNDLARVAPHIAPSKAPSEFAASASNSLGNRKMTARQRLSTANGEPEVY